MVYRFDSYLQPGETILWQGEPDEISYALCKVMRDLALMAPLCLFAMWFEFDHLGLIKIQSIWWWIIFIAVTIWTGLTMYPNMRDEAGATAYAITNERVLIRHISILVQREMREKVETISLLRLKPKLQPSFRGVRTIVFGLPGFDFAIAFRHIANADSVFRQLTAARATLLVQGIDKTDLADFNIQEHLRRNEHVSWQGRPDKRAFAHTRLVSEALALLAIVALFSFLFLMIAHLFTWLLWIGVLVAASIAVFPLTMYGLMALAGAHRYFATNQRVIVLGRGINGGVKRFERELREAHNMTLLPCPFDTGTIQLEKHSPELLRVIGPKATLPCFSLKCLENAEDVLAMLRDAHEHSNEDLLLRLASGRSPD